MDRAARRSNLRSRPCRLAELDLIAHNHLLPRGEDDGRGRARLRREHADLSENLPGLVGPRAGTEHRQKVSRRDLVVAAKVDLDEVAFHDAEVPAAGVDDVAGRAAAGRIAPLRKIRDAGDGDGQLRDGFEARTDGDLRAGLGDDRAGTVALDAEDADLADVVVLAADDLVRVRMTNDLVGKNSEVGLAGDEARAGAARDINEI